MLKKLIIPPNELSYHALGKMSAFILSFFIILSLAYRYSPKDNFLDSAEKLYSTTGFYAGEKALSSYLEKHPENQDAWLSLIQWRYRISQNREPLSQKDFNGFQNLLTSPQTKLFLSPDEFEEKLKKCPFFSPEEIKAITLSELGTSLNSLITYIDKSQKGKPSEFSLSLIEKTFIREDNFQISKSDASKLQKFSALYPQNKNSKHIQYLLNIIQGKTQTASLELSFSEPAFLDYKLHSFFMKEKKYLPASYHLIRSQIQGHKLLNLSIVILSGSAWLLLLMHLGHAWHWESKYKWLIPLALILGILSTYSTLIVAVLQDHLMQHEQRPKTFIYNLIYYMLGVGLREELIKLIFFLPLLPLLKNCRDHAVIFILASIVGLGFAMEENVNYYSSASISTVIVGRFMTANFLHAALTGLAGYSLWTAWQKGGDHWQFFTNQFLKIIALHGAYDFLLVDKSMGDLSYFSMTVFIILTLEYTRTILHFSSYRQRDFTLTQLFIACLVTVIGLNLFFLVYQTNNFGLSLQIMASGLLGLVFIAYAFLREFNETVN